jgi:lipoprotein
MTKNFLMLLCGALLLGGCSSSFISFKEKNPFKKAVVFTKNDKEIIYIPMIHLGQPEFYGQIKQFVTQKRNEGYKIYYEKLTYGTSDSLVQDTLLLKARKITGYYFKGIYTDKNNATSPFRDKYEQFTRQTEENTGIDIEKDFRVDLNMRQLIAQIESDHSPIVLDSCDYATPPTAKYNCKQYKEYSRLFLRTYRDEYLLATLLATPHKKIILLYGVNHYDFLSPELKKAGFEERKFGKI